MPKITAPDSIADYLKRTEHAVRHSYDGLASCAEVYNEAEKHWNVSRLQEPMTPELKRDLDRYLDLARQYFNLKFSEATFAGSILQTAYMGIRLYSKVTMVPNNCEGLVRPQQKGAIPFCIGEERYGVPLGLLIYAGRNQYAHWDEETSHATTKAVFMALSKAFFDVDWADLMFNLANPTINIYAGELLAVAIGWNTFDEYEAGMTKMLDGETER